MIMDWIRKAPTAVIVAIVVVCGFGAVAVLGGYVALEYAGRPTGGYLQFVNMLINVVLLLTTGTGALAAVSGARSSTQAAEQTNGQLHERDLIIQAKDRELARLRYELNRQDGAA